MGLNVVAKVKQSKKYSVSMRQMFESFQVATEGGVQTKVSGRHNYRKVYIALKKVLI